MRNGVINGSSWAKFAGSALLVMLWLGAMPTWASKGKRTGSAYGDRPSPGSLCSAVDVGAAGGSFGLVSVTCASAFHVPSGKNDTLFTFSLINGAPPLFVNSFTVNFPGTAPSTIDWGLVVCPLTGDTDFNCTTAGSPVDFNGPTDLNGNLILDSSGDVVLTFSNFSNAQSGNVTLFFSTPDSSGGTAVKVLSVTTSAATPEPGALALLSLGLAAGYCLFQRRLKLSKV